MTDFKKYKSIENHYREKNIRDMLRYNPIYNNCKYIATEKIDGANFQFRFRKISDDIVIEFGNRNSILKQSDSFYDYQSVVKKQKYQDFIYCIKSYMKNNSFNENEITDVIVYGELFGPKIQRRINYGVDSNEILFYDMCINEEYLTQEQFLSFMENNCFTELIVPIFGYYNTIDDALSVDVEGSKTALNPGGDKNLLEGIVIKPYDTIARNKNDEQVLFYIKKKTDAFKDQMRVNKKHKQNLPVEVTDAMAIYESYLSENRLMDLFGKQGKINDISQIKDYVILMMNDAKEDFLKDNMDIIEKVPKKYKKMVFSRTGKIVSKMCFKYI